MVQLLPLLHMVLIISHMGVSITTVTVSSNMASLSTASLASALSMACLGGTKANPLEDGNDFFPLPVHKCWICSLLFMYLCTNELRFNLDVILALALLYINSRGCVIYGFSFLHMDKFISWKLETALNFVVPSAFALKFRFQ